MSFQQFPTPLYVIALLPSANSTDALGGFQLDNDMDLKYVLLSVVMFGTPTTERSRLKIYGQAALESVISTSEWRDLSDFTTPQIGTLRFDFTDPVPINAEIIYYIAIETENPSASVILDCVLDWSNDVYTYASATSRGAQMRFIGYREVSMGQVRRLNIAEGATITAPASLSFVTSDIAMIGGWTSPDGSGAPSLQENGSTVYQFPDAADVELDLFLKVPANYQAGNQVNMTISLYSPSASGTVKMKATTYLVRDNTDAVSSTTNSYPSTNAALTNASANRARKTSIDLTTSAGLINSVSVAAGDHLRVVLTRDYANDTDTGAVRVLPLAEVSFG